MHSADQLTKKQSPHGNRFWSYAQCRGQLRHLGEAAVVTADGAGSSSRRSEIWCSSRRALPRPFPPTWPLGGGIDLEEVKEGLTKGVCEVIQEEAREGLREGPMELIIKETADSLGETLGCCETLEETFG